MSIKRLVFLTLLTCLACGRGHPTAWWGTVDTLSSGAIVVQNIEVGIWDTVTAWHFGPERRIGSIKGTGPDVFSGIRGLAVDEAVVCMFSMAERQASASLGPIAALCGPWVVVGMVRVSFGPLRALARRKMACSGSLIRS